MGYALIRNIEINPSNSLLEEYRREGSGYLPQKTIYQDFMGSSEHFDKIMYIIHSDFKNIKKSYGIVSNKFSVKSSKNDKVGEFYDIEIKNIKGYDISIVYAVVYLNSEDY